MTNDVLTKLYKYFSVLSLNDIHISNCALYVGTNSNTLKHHHDTLELDYFLKGQHSIRVGASTIPIVAHTYNVVGYMPQCSHQGCLLQPQETICIWIDIPTCPNELSTSFRLNDNSGALRWLFEQIYKEQEAELPESQTLMRHYAYCIIQQIARQLRSPSAHDIEDDIVELLQYIEDNYSLDITPDQMARKLNISKSYLHKAFRENVGVTPLRYIQNVRMEHAKALLGVSKYSIQQVAEMVGYDDARYFSRVFKLTANMTPREWKKANSAT